MHDLCFANEKISDFSTYSELTSMGLTCYALKDSEFRRNVKEGRCGTMRCPFFKPKRSDIRLSNKIIHVEK